MGSFVLLNDDHFHQNVNEIKEEPSRRRFLMSPFNEKHPIFHSVPIQMIDSEWTVSKRFFLLCSIFDFICAP